MRISHISWNLIGLGVPLLIAAVTVPHLLSALGPQRFGLLTLAWGLIGYASALDFGVGRAATHQIAELRGAANAAHDEVAVVLSTAVTVTAVTGGLAALCVIASLLFGVESFVKADQVPVQEIRLSIMLLAVALPLQAISAAYRGVNEAFLHFRGISVVRILLGGANFGFPFLIALFTQKIYRLVMSLVASRGVALFVYRYLAHQCMDQFIGANMAKFSKEAARRLIKFGGWFTLSSVLNPVVAAADRFYIASLISATVVAAYVIPYEMVAQSLILVGAVTTVIFPFLSQIRISDPERARKIFLRALMGSAFVMSLATLAFWILGGAILDLWLGSSIPEQSRDIVRVLSLGLAPYALGTMCVAQLHSMGRTDWTAKINIIEFPLFLALVFYFIKNFGLIGAAWAWVLRVTVDATLLLLASLKSK